MKKEDINNLIYYIGGILVGLIICLFCISFISATYAGEKYNHTFTEQNLFNCSVNNPLLNITLDNQTSTVFVQIPADYDLTTFIITCYVQGEETPVTHSGGGGHHHPVLNTTNTTNITNTTTQQGNNSGTFLNTNFSASPAENDTPNISILTNPDALNEETKSFIDKYGIWLFLFLIFILGLALVYYALVYYAMSGKKEDEGVDNTPTNTNENKEM